MPARPISRPVPLRPAARDPLAQVRTSIVPLSIPRGALGHYAPAVAALYGRLRAAGRSFRHAATVTGYVYGLAPSTVLDRRIRGAA